MLFCLPTAPSLPSLFSCRYTTTGSFSRSAVNNSVGAQTPLAGIFTALTVMLVLLCLTPVFTHMSANVQVRGRGGQGLEPTCNPARCVAD